MNPGDYLSLVTGGGGALVVLAVAGWALATGKLHSHAEFGRMEEAWQQEKRRGDQLQQALELANARADAGTRAGELTASILQALHAGSPQP